MNQGPIDFSQPIKRRDSSASPLSAPKLREAEQLFRSEESAAGDSELLFLPERKTLAEQAPQQLPDVQLAASFWKNCKDVFEFPSTPLGAQTGGGLRLEDMLAEIRILNPEKAKELFLQALDFLPHVDPAFGRGPGRGEPPFETLKHRSDVVSELYRHTSQLLREVRRFYSAEPVPVLSTFISRIVHYRSETKAPLGEPLEVSALLASIEMIYDAGEKPLMRAPEKQMSKGVAAPEAKATPKRLNYGREPVATEGASPEQGSTPEQDPEKAEWLSASARAEEERVRLERDEQDEFTAFKNRVREPAKPFGMYGRMIGPKAVNKTYGDLFADAAPEIRYNRVPSPLQDLTVALSSWARSYIRYGEQYLKGDKLTGWMSKVEPAALEKEVRVRRDTVSVYQRIIAVANELPLSEDFQKTWPGGLVLSATQQRVLEQIAPRIHFNGRSQADGDDPILAATMRARRDVDINEKIRAEARKIDDNDEHPRLKGLTDRAERYRIAEELARHAVLNPKRLNQYE